MKNTLVTPNVTLSKTEPEYLKYYQHLTAPIQLTPPHQLKQGLSSNAKPFFFA
jgi:hypothetical protein